MKKRMFQIALALAVLATATIGGMAGCSCTYQDARYGYFTVRYFERRSYCDITGLTEEGAQQKELVFPKTINGVPVQAIGKRAAFSIYIRSLNKPDIASDKLEKVYFNKHFSIHLESFVDCPNLKKAMKIFTGYSLEINMDKVKNYYCLDTYNEVFNNSKIYAANVSYKYNYDVPASTEQGVRSEDRYYWIDDYDYGSKIEFIPDDPIREGYTFDGWYKEEECINKWDFDSDTLPAEKYNEDNTLAYQETVLYAKWA